MSDIENILLVLSTTITSVLVTIGALITLLYAIRKKNHIILLFSISWFLYGSFLFLDAIAHYSYSTFIMSIAMIPQIIMIPCLVVFMDFSRKERVNTIRLAFLIIIGLFILFSTIYIEDNWEVIPGYGVHNKGILRIFQIMYIMYFVFYYFNWSYKTWKKAPQDLKKLTSYLLFGSILFSIVTACMYALGTFIRIFNAFAFIFSGTGAFITIIAILKDPKIIYILPFTAYRLLVVDSSTGNTLFKHDWVHISGVEENIFSMVLQAVGNILDDILKKGDVREIQMEQAILLIQHSKKYPIASMLVASASSKSLRYGLNKFNEQFLSKFKSDLYDLNNIKKFEKAEELIDKVFDFVPKYKI